MGPQCRLGNHKDAGATMKVGDLVRMKDCKFNIFGVIVYVFMCDLGLEEVYKIAWIDDLCDDSFANATVLEVVYASR